MPVCNDTLAHSSVDREDGYGGSNVTFHKGGLAVSAVFAIIATVMSLYLMMQHALHYSRPWEQKHIIRILFMVPIYALISWLSFWQYKNTIYYQVIRDCYEAFAIASFFTLMCNYCAPNLHEQKEYFRHQRPKNWVLPLNWFQRCTGGKDRGFLRVPKSGLTLFNILWSGIFQYCFIRILMTFVALITQATDRYCESSLNPAFSHIWVQVLNALGVTIAMYCIIQFYVQIKDDIQEHKPVLKLAAIKLVIFFSFWQSFLIGFASTHVQPTTHIYYNDIKVGVPSILLCIEMAIFSILHLWAFPWKEPYSLKDRDPINAPGAGYTGKPHYEGGPFGLKAYADAANPWDIIKSSARGFRWLFVGVRHRRQDSSYNQASTWDADNGVLGPSADNGAGIYNSNTKLGPVGNGRPNPMHRDRHMSREHVEDVSRRQSAERRAESGNASSTYVPSGSGSSVGTRWPGQSTGDLADVPPREYDTSYHGGGQGKKAYYGDELPPAPYPAYPGGGSPYSANPFEDPAPSLGARGLSPLRGEDSDTAGLLARAGGGAGAGSAQGAGRHPEFRR